MSVDAARKSACATSQRLRVCIVALFAVTGGGAQALINPARLAPALLSFEPAPGESALKCDVTRMPATMNFGFRFQAGYRVRVPMSQYEGRGHIWSILTRVTSETGGQPVYLADRIRLPEVPKTKVVGEFGGIYLVGEGRYRVAWKMWDGSGRVCRGNWSFEAKRKGDERRVEAALPSGAVTDISLRGAPRRARPPDDARPIRLTVLLHAAPLTPRRTRLSARDRGMLVGTLSSLLERLPTKSVRLVAFNLDQQKELFRQDDFRLENLGGVATAINETEMGTVDYRILMKRRGHTEMLARLLNAELNEDDPADVVLLLGGTSRFIDKLPDGTLEKVPDGPPQFFFLRYDFAARMQPRLPDTIAMAMSKVRAKTVWIRTPGDFARAIDMVERRVSGTN